MYKNSQNHNEWPNKSIMPNIYWMYTTQSSGFVWPLRPIFKVLAIWMWFWPKLANFDSLKIFLKSYHKFQLKASNHEVKRLCSALHYTNFLGFGNLGQIWMWFWPKSADFEILDFDITKMGLESYTSPPLIHMVEALSLDLL